MAQFMQLSQWMLVRESLIILLWMAKILCLRISAARLQKTFQSLTFLTEKHDMEYLELVDKNTLEEKQQADADTIVLIACRVEGVRLIDNIYLGE